MKVFLAVLTVACGLGFGWQREPVAVRDTGWNPPVAVRDTGWNPPVAVRDTGWNPPAA